MSQEGNVKTKPIVEEWRGERSKKLLSCSKMSTGHMKEYFYEIKRRVDQGEPVIWGGTDLPQEIFHAMDILFMPSIWYGSLISAKQQSRYYLEKLNSRGYFRDLCRYCPMTLGYVLDHNDEIAPWGGLPKPTVVINITSDDPMLKMFELIAREYNLPHFVLEKSWQREYHPRWWEHPEKAVERYREDHMVAQLEAMIRFLEVHTGKTLQESKLREVIKRSNQLYEYIWKAVDLIQDMVPCPIPITDCLANIIPSQYFRGLPWGVEQAKRFYEEIKERVEQGQAVCENEKIRLYWHGIPPWFSPGFFNTWEEKYGAVFIGLGYLNGLRAFIRHDLSDPIRTIANRYTEYLGFHYMPERNDWEIYNAKKSKIDGAIFMLAESCKLLYTGVHLLKKRFEDEGIPVLEFTADMVDAREWDDIKIKANITSFIETLL